MFVVPGRLLSLGVLKKALFGALGEEAAGRIGAA